MRSLIQSLQDHDRGHLQAIAELWGFDLPPGDSLASAKFLAAHLTNTEDLNDMVESLAGSARTALDRLIAEGGSLLWADFVQGAGELRVMGPARRDRMKPWRDPISAAEHLYYRGLVGRAFAETPAGARELAYVPRDLLPVLPSEDGEPLLSLGTAAERPEHISLATAAIVDDVTTLLAGLRQSTSVGKADRPSRFPDLGDYLVFPRSLEMLLALGRELGLLEAGDLSPRPGAIREFLQADRGRALHQLALAWLRSKLWHDFQLLTHLDPGNVGWPTQPDLQRQAALLLLERVDASGWWDLDALIQSTREQYPSYARPGAGFSSWILRDRRTGVYLRGIEAWESIDGAYLRSLVTGPLHWLGVVDLGSSQAINPPESFRLSKWFHSLFQPGESPRISEPSAPATVHSDGRIEIPRGAARDLRYQVARLSSWYPYDSDRYRYRLHPSAVLAAAQEGLGPDHLHRLLSGITASEPAPTLIHSINRLFEQGVEARIEEGIVVRFEDPKLLDQLMRNREIRRSIAERVGPTTALVVASRVEELLQSVASLGYLVEPPPST
jgi:hypothetical protein